MSPGMTPGAASIFAAEARSGWLRLRTFIVLRWLTLGGQAAVALVCLLLGVAVPVGPLLAILGAATLFNLAARAAAPVSRRLTEREAMAMLVFDLVQVAAVLFFTGGLATPFALMVLGPVTVGAAALSFGATAVLCAAAIALLTFLAAYDVPWRLVGGAAIPAGAWPIKTAWLALSVGLVFVAGCAHRMSGEIFRLSRALTAARTALEQERRVSAISALMAAAAHELGTPLATIKLVSTELAEELRDQPALRAEAELIRAQADRCRDILHAMAASELQESQIRMVPISALVEEAAAPHAGRGVRIILRLRGVAAQEFGARQPEMPRRPEIVQGLRNLVQNAVDFARACVWIDIDWTLQGTTVAIGDDGRGYPPDLIASIGEPFLRARDTAPERPGYDGRGLGLFIARTLLERSGARISFRNGSDDPPSTRPTSPPDSARPTGAIAEVAWGAPARGAPPHLGQG